MKPSWLIISLAFLLQCEKKNESTLCPEGDGIAAAALKSEGLPERQLVLTFDDGPAADTPRLLYFLKARGIPAAFFVIGSGIPGQESILARMRSGGHLVGNHTYTHPDLTAARDVVAEVMRTDELISPFVAGKMFLLRPPYGAFTEDIASRLNSAGLAKYAGPIDWDIGDSQSGQYSSDTECWDAGRSEADCAEIFRREVKDRGRGIMLLHDSYPKTVAMTELLIPKLQAEGYSFVRLDEVPAVRQRLAVHGSVAGEQGRRNSCWYY